MEAFLNLYTNLNNLKMVEKGRVISVCSSYESEGKSMITAQLGKLLASFGVNVLLIDMNMKSPTLHQYFHMENREGVDRILSNQEIPQALIQTNGIKNLSLITAGTKKESDATKVFSPKTQSFLENMRENYDVVLIDTAAINDRLDAAAIMRLCDANLYVFRKGKTKKRKLAEAQDFIKAYHVPNVYLVYNQG